MRDGEETGVAGEDLESAGADGGSTLDAGELAGGAGTGAGTGSDFTASGAGSG